MFVEVAPPAAIAALDLPHARRSMLRRAAAVAPPYLYLLPALAGLLLWVYLPLAQTFRLSFYEWDLLPTTPKIGVGLHKYDQALSTPGVGQAAVNTLIYVAALIPFAIVIPLGIALMTRSLGERSRNLYRGLIFLPFLLAPVATAIVWRWLLAADGGPVNRAIEALGGSSVNWLREATPALISIIVMTGWKLIGYCTLMFSAGLASINSEYAAAASVDGASRSQITRWITLPLLSPTLMLLTLMTLLLSAQWTFPLIDTLTQGGPANATTNLYYLLYDYAFSTFDVGLSSAAGVLFFLLFAVLAFFGVRLMDRYSFHDD
jgi:multiple sugar transport system permease protein